MSVVPRRASAGRRLETLRSDPRLHPRYAITLDVEYTLKSKGRVLHGFGQTVNISSGGILLAVANSLPIGGLIELAVNWPYLLDGSCPLKLKIRGRIVRSDAKEIAVQIEKHEFRTAGSHSKRQTIREDRAVGA